MKKEMDIQRYKIQITRFTHEVFHSHLERVYEVQKWAVNSNVSKFNKQVTKVVAYTIKIKIKVIKTIPTF